jgi:hypothetical protein
MLKKVSFFILCFSLLSINTNLIVTAQDNPIFWGQDYYLNYEVYAPTEIKLNETFTVTFLIRPKYNVEVDLINVIIYGNVEPDGKWGKWEGNWENMTMFADVEYNKTKTFNVASIEDGSEGHLYGIILANYDYQEHAELYDAGFFEITTIGKGSYNELLDSYNEYMENHYHSNREYNLLKTDYISLQSQSNTDPTRFQYLSYFLLATTVLFVATTIYFARRKPKTC